MSDETVEVFKRAVEANNSRDIEALLKVLDPGIEWHPALAVLLGEETVYRGHDGVRKFFRDIDAAFVDVRAEFTEIRDLGDRIVAIGSIRMRGKASGAETESPLGYLVDFKDGKMVQVRTHLDAEQTLEAAGLRE